MTVSLVRTTLDPAALRLFAETAHMADDDLNYALHTALRRRFGAAAPQPFRWPVPNADPGVLLGYVSDPAPLLGGTETLPDWSTDWSSPAALERIFCRPFDARPMPSAFAPQTRLAFNVRLRPVRRYGKRLRALRKTEGQREAGERDAFLAAIAARDAQGETHDTTPIDREQTYAAWLAEKLSPAAEIETLRMVAFHRQRTLRKNGANARARLTRIEAPDAEFDGVLRVREPDAFMQRLAHGVGRHRAFGFGMLLLRPAGR